MLHVATAQVVSYDWANKTGSYNTVYCDATPGVVDMKQDAAGNLFTCGSYNGLIDFDPGAGVDTLNGYSNYLSKTTSSGAHAWVRPVMGGTIQRMAMDKQGNVYFTGFFTGTMDLDPSPTGTYYITSNNSSLDIFVCKYDSSGTLVWGHAFGDSGEDRGNSITVDQQGNVYLTGFINGIPDMDPGPAVQSLYTLYDDVFVLKLDSNGAYVWAGNFTGFGYDRGRDLAVDNAGNVYITGNYTGTTDFDPGPNTFNLVGSTSSRDAFLVKLNSSGNLVWAKSFGDFNDDWGDNITIDKNGDPILSGFFSSVMDCDPGPGTYTLTPTYYNDFFLLKLTAAGNFMWARQFGQAATTYSYFQPAIRHAIDSLGNIYITGNYKDTADFDPGPGVHNLYTVWDPNTWTYDYGIYVLFLDQVGNYKWSASFQHGGQGNWGNAIVVDSLANVYVAGTFNDTIDFDPGPNTHLLQTPATQFGSYGTSAFLLKLHQCFTTTGTVSASACQGYLLNGFTYTQTGTYTQTLSNAGGCDSILTLQLTIPVIDTSITQTSTQLIANAASATYTWIDCNTLAPVSGATQQQFTPPSYGTYAVVVTKNACTDTSACRTFIPLGLHDAAAGSQQLRISPNPASTTLTVSCNDMTSICLYDMAGQLVQKQQAQHAHRVSLDLSRLNNGVFLLIVENGKGERLIQKFTKE